MAGAHLEPAGPRASRAAPSARVLVPRPDRAAPAQGEAARLLSPALFRSRVVPVLLRLFEVHEEHVRVVLLSHLEAYVGHLPREQLRTVVLPQVSRARGPGRGGGSVAGIGGRSARQARTVFPPHSCGQGR